MSPKAPIIEMGERGVHPRKIQQAVDVLRRGGIVCYPTDTVYGFACDSRDRKAIDRLYQVKNLPRGHRLSFVCESFSQIAEYAMVDDFAYRWLRRLLPGPYTIILPATRAVPRLLLEKRREIGVRLPEREVCVALVRELGAPMLTTSATDARNDDLLVDADEVQALRGNQIDLILDGGMLTRNPSTVLRIENDTIELIREGKGPTDTLPFD